MTTDTTDRPDVLWYTRCPVPSPLGIACLLYTSDAADEA